MTEHRSAGERPWFSHKPGVEPPGADRRDNGAGNLWRKCEGCAEILHVPDVEANASVCPLCQYHFPLDWRSRVRLLVDEGSFEETDRGISPQDPLKFFDSKSYRDRLEETQAKRGGKDAFINGRATIEGRAIWLGTFDFQFMGGSMGSVVGEKVTRLFEYGAADRAPVVIVSASGGARMQEGILSLMQMAKSTAALQRMRRLGVPFVSVLTHPTTGGVAASFAMLGDVILAEPKALIGFAGPRVIEQTIRQKLPPGFQRSEYLLDHGMLDAIVHRGDLRPTLARLFGLLTDPA